MNKKASPKSLVDSVEQTYFDLREKNPDRDEHWFLANTWLRRYGSTEEAKQKGPELLKFIAYKETHLFSVLEPPESIRGLALFLVHKELGERQAMYYADEFSQIMEPIMRSRANHVFPEKYKQKNPRTWKEGQVEDDSSYSLYCLLRGLEFEQERPEEAEQLVRDLFKRMNDHN